MVAGPAPEFNHFEVVLKVHKVSGSNCWVEDMNA